MSSFFTRFRKRLPVPFTIGVVAVAVLVVGLFFIGRSKQTVAREALERFASASAYHAQTTLKLELPPRLRGRERPFTDVTIELDGDVITGQEPEFTGTLYAEARGRGNIFFADGELRFLSDAAVFRLENLPVLLNPSGSLVKKWTYVGVPILATSNAVDVLGAWANVFADAHYIGKETRDGRTLYHFVVPLSVEQEERLADVLQYSRSASNAWHVVARLLAGTDVRSLDVWVDADSSTLAFIEAAFVIPLTNADPYEYGTLKIALSEYNKPVSVERPPKELTVRPEVFAKLFGSGEVGKLRVDAQ